MKMTSIHKLSDEELADIEDALNPFAFEQYCGACIYFETDDCPFLEKATTNTKWKEELKCTKFYD